MQRAGRLLAVRCASSALELEGELRATIETIARRLFPPKNMTEAESLAFGGDEVVAELEYKERRRAREAAACVRALRLIGSPRAMAALNAYLEDERMTVINEVIQSVNPLEARIIRSRLFAGERLEYDILRRISDLDPLRDCGKAVSIYLPYIRASSLEPLSTCSGLERLNLVRAKIGNWSGLTQIKSLETLELSGSNLSDDAVNFISQLKHLRFLTINATSVSAFGPLANCIELRTLNVSGTEAPTLDGLQRLSQLEDLVVGSRVVMSIAELAGAPALRKLTILNSPNLRDFQVLPTLAQLEELGLQSSSGADLTPLLRCQGLRRLSCSGRDADQIVTEGNFPLLERLAITPQSLNSLEGLKRSPLLESLILRNWKADALLGIEATPKLKTLDVTSSTLRSLSGIESLKNLEVIRLSVSAKTDCSALVNCAKLRKIEIPTPFGNASLSAALNRMPGVTVQHAYRLG